MRCWTVGSRCTGAMESRSSWRPRSSTRDAGFSGGCRLTSRISCERGGARGGVPVSVLLSLSGVGKDYAKADGRGGRLRLVVDLLRGRPAAEVFCALDGVTLEMTRGSSLGVIGENGAGKSTLLKIVAGVIKPTRGTVAINGRVGALLELGSGVHPGYTRRENIDLTR